MDFQQKPELYEITTLCKSDSRNANFSIKKMHCKEFLIYFTVVKQSGKLQAPFPSWQQLTAPVELGIT